MTKFVYLIMYEDGRDYDSYRSVMSAWTDPGEALWQLAEILYQKGNGGSRGIDYDIDAILLNVPTYSEDIDGENAAIADAIGMNILTLIKPESVAE
jgi:hypothetical protein